MIHKSRERSVGGYWEVYYSGYSVITTHNIPCNPPKGNVVVSFWWKDVTCKKCLGRMQKKARRDYV